MILNNVRGLKHLACVILLSGPPWEKKLWLLKKYYLTSKPSPLTQILIQKRKSKIFLWFHTLTICVCVWVCTRRYNQHCLRGEPKFGHSTLLVTRQTAIIIFFLPKVLPSFRFSPLPTVVISNQYPSIIHWFY